MNTIIERILEIARDTDHGDALLELTISAADEALYDAANAEFGGWDAALVAALHEAVKGSAKPRVKARVEEEVIRKRTSAAGDAIFTTTTHGGYFRIAGDEFELTEAPEKLDMPEGLGVMKSFLTIGEPDGVFVVSNQGRYFGIDPRMVPEWMGESDLRPMRNILPLDIGEEICLVLPRRAGRDGRYIHITRGGKGKATDAKELGRTLDRNGREAFLLKEGDAPIAVFSGPTKSHVFCASAHGQGIHFDAKADMRSMGRKAVGVNVMKLSGADDEIIGAFLTEGVEQIAMITASGLAKRVWFEEFRPQGRGGAGMQLCNLEPDDRVVGAVACNPGHDLAVTTSTGRVHRFEATHFELMGRPAKGHHYLTLTAGEKIIGLSTLPCSTSSIFTSDEEE